MGCAGTMARRSRIPEGPVLEGPEALRAVRGGSWFNSARRARSAFRDAAPTRAMPTTTWAFACA